MSAAVMPLAVAQQLLRIAEQARPLKRHPDVLQLCDLVRIIGQLPLLAKPSGWLTISPTCRSIPADLRNTAGAPVARQRWMRNLTGAPRGCSVD